MKPEKLFVIILIVAFVALLTYGTLGNPEKLLNNSTQNNSNYVAPFVLKHNGTL